MASAPIADPGGSVDRVSWVPSLLQAVRHVLETRDSLAAADGSAYGFLWNWAISRQQRETMKVQTKRRIPDLFRTEAANVTCDRIVCPESIEDLAKELCASTAKHIVVVGGGHSQLCTRTEALVIDLKHSHAFSQVTVVQPKQQQDEEGDNNSPIIEMGGGANLERVAAALKGSGYSVPIGTYPTVGAGLVLQGGIGFLTRQFGLTVDAIIGAELVDTTGKVWSVSKEDDDSFHRDLLWALKGAGNQVGGVVTKIKLKTFAAEDMWMERILLRASSVESLARHLAAAWEIALGLPNSDNLSLIISNVQEKDVFNMYFVYTRAFVDDFDVETFEESCTGRGFLLDKFREVDGLILEEVFWKEEKQRSYNDTAGLLDIPLDYIDIDLGRKPPYVAIGHAFIGGQNFLAKATEIAESIANQLAEVPDNLFGQIHFQQVGGAMRDVPPDATAFWNRSQTDFSTVIVCLCSDDDNLEKNLRQAYAWTDSVERVLADIKMGTYSVDILRQQDLDGLSGLSTKDQLLEAYGDNWKKIESVRSVLDPRGLMRPHDM